MPAACLQAEFKAVSNTTEKKLTRKQKEWIAAYKKSGNATLAAKEAGYKCTSQKSFETMGSKNLRRLGGEIKAYEAKLDGDRIASVQEINEFWTELIRDGEASCSNRLKASELRMKALGGFITNQNPEPSGVSVTFIDDTDDKN